MVMAHPGHQCGPLPLGLLLPLPPGFESDPGGASMLDPVLVCHTCSRRMRYCPAHIEVGVAEAHRVRRPSIPVARPAS